MKINNLEINAKEVILECFNKIPFISIKEIDSEMYFGDTRADLTFCVKSKEATTNLIAEVKNNGEPRFARQAVNQLRRYLDSYPEYYGIFVAPYLSPRAIDICKESGIGYIDFAGNCLISFGMIYIQQEGNSNPFTRKRYIRSLYSPKAERVLRVLLASSFKDWKTEELAKEANVSLGQVANVKKLLSDQEWIDSKSVGFSLSEPLSLFEDWAKNYKYRRNKIQNCYSMQNLSNFEYKLGQYCQENNIRYGLTGFSGSTRYAPVVRYQRVMAYIQGDIENIAKALDIKPVDSGFNVTLLEPYDEGVFYNSQLIDDLIIVSPLQVYLDLKSLRGRGEEAAQELFEEVIQKLW